MPTLDPRDPQFWNIENARLWEEISPLAMRALLAGATTAARQLPVDIAPLINWDLFNESAISYLHQYRLSTITGITESTRRQAILAIDNWIREGAPLGTLQSTLAPVFGRTRAESIAITEVTRVYAEGNLRLWQSTGLVGVKRWQTAFDDRVCPICRPFHDTIVEIDGAFSHSAADLEASKELQRIVRRQGSLFRAPPAHVRCRCWLQPGVSEVALREQVRSTLADGFIAAIRRGEVGAYVTS